MIKINLQDILNAKEVFSEIMEQSFKGSLAFQIARLIRELNKEIETFNFERQKILEEYCEKNSEGKIIILENKNVKIKEDKVNDFNKELSSLLKTEIEINADKLPLSAIDDFNITPQQVFILEKFFE